MKAPFNKQAIFDRVAAALIAQGRKSADGTGTCLYRGPDGLRCGVGHIMSDDAAARACDAQGDQTQVNVLPSELLDPALDYRLADRTDRREKQLDFLQSMQNAHDNASNGGDRYDDDGNLINDEAADNAAWLKDWSRQMRGIATRNRLNANVLKAASL